MPDLLSHVLVGYALGTALCWRVERLQPHHVPLVMGGAVLPDLSKLFLVVKPSTVEGVIGAPFDWTALHTIGGVLVLGAAGALLLDPSNRRLGYTAIVAGGVGHLVLDLGVVRATGLAPPYLYPFTAWQPPSADLFLSSHYWPLGVALALATLVWYLDRRSDHRSPGPGPQG